MKNVIIYIFLLFLISCKTVTPTIIQEGSFIHEYKDGATTQLILRKNGSFDLKFSYKQGCSGKWLYVPMDTIIIDCNTVDWTETITKGFMHERKQEIIILDEKRLKLPVFNNVKKKYIILNRRE